MATAARLSFGPNDHGRFVVGLDLDAADWAEGYRYEVIDGRLSVSPIPGMPHHIIDDWLRDRLKAYAQACPEVFNHVAGPVRVYVPGRRALTVPEPDLAAYRNFPRGLRPREFDWQDYSPLLVIEILSPDDREKDTVRNVALYRQVPSIKEYWIVDPTIDPDLLALIVYRRRGRGWQRPLDIAPGGTYTTPLLPGFSLTLDPTS